MLPRPTAYDRRDSRKVDTVSAAKLSKALASHVSAANLPHVVVGQVGLVVTRPSWRIIGKVDGTPLGLHVMEIHGLGAKEQVSWIVAGRVVAGMANHHPCRNFAVRDVPCESRSDPAFLADPQLAVPVIQATIPDPTLVRTKNCDERPELFNVLRSKHATSVARQTYARSGMTAIPLSSHRSRQAQSAAVTT